MSEGGQSELVSAPIDIRVILLFLGRISPQEKEYNKQKKEDAKWMN